MRDETFDLVLMDLQMPIMDGLSTTREIRALPGCAHLPIIAMTANAYAEDRAQCPQAGMNDYPAKPIEAPVLFAALDRWLPDTAPAAGQLPTMPEGNTFRYQGQRQTHRQRRFGRGHRPSVGRAWLCRHYRSNARAIQAGTLHQAPETTLHGAWRGRLILTLLDHRNTDDATQEARRVAHTLKGVAATFGLTELSVLAGRLQEHMGIGKQPCASCCGCKGATGDVEASRDDCCENDRPLITLCVGPS